MPLLVRDWIRRYTQADLHLFQRLLVPQDDFGNDFGRRTVEAVALWLHAVEVPGHEFYEAFMTQGAGGSDDYVSRHKTSAIEVRDGFALESLDRVPGPQNWTSEGMVLPEILGEDFMDQIVGAVLVHLDFFQNHSALAHNVLGVENWIQNQIAENVERDGQMFVKHLDAEADALLGGKGVNISADGIHLPGNVLRRPMLGSLEYHVLNEM